MTTETTERNFERDFTEAPRDEPILVLVPTGDTEQPLIYDIASWDYEDDRWAGEWQEEYPDAQPVGWCYLPTVDDDLVKEYGLGDANEGDAAA